MRLPEIFVDLPVACLTATIPDVEITGIAFDTRKLKPGELFVALRGESQDGHDHIGKAVENGAAAVVGERERREDGIPYVRVEDSRRALTWLAAAFYGHPGRKLTVIGVTGTDGKTTTCNLLYQVLKAAGLRAGMISTVNAIIGEEVLDTGFHVTTPDAPDVQHYLAMMSARGLTHVILETTSHGLAQHRADAACYDLAVVTNITHEHLDEHGSYEKYRAAKQRLFEMLTVSAHKAQAVRRLAVLNRDDRSYETLDAYCQAHAEAFDTVSYGLRAGADLRAEEILSSPEGTDLVILEGEQRTPIHTQLVGEFNVYNCLAAYAAAVRGLGVEREAARRGIAALQGVPGRMERIDLGQDFTAIVDFAHTPNALRVALETARALRADSAHPGGRILAVFGSAGLRDKEKRRMMAEVAQALADLSIFTAEDPRTESLDGILEEMAEGARAQGGKEGKTFFRIADRGEALRFAVRHARAGDILLTCGKGHEQSMCFGRVEYPWDDRVALRAALAERLGVEGPAMPSLPTGKQGA